MKQVTPIILTLILMLSFGSCHKDKITVKQQTQIVMGASSTNGTKAVVSSKKSLVDVSLAQSTGFGVFGYKNYIDQSASAFRVFNNPMVEPHINASVTPADTSWTYTPIRYWDSNPNVTYYFIAYWPWIGTTSGNDTYVEESNRTLTIHNIPNWQDSVNALDIMTSARNGQYRTTQSTEPLFYGGKVNFNFSHILAKFIIRGYYIGDISTHITVHKITLMGSDFLLSNGVADYSEQFGEQVNPTAAFGTVSTGNTDRILFDDTPQDVDGCELPETSFDDEIAPATQVPQTICTWLTVPSSGFQNLSLKISFSIGQSAPQDITVTGLTIGSGTTVKSNSYIITLKFDSSSGGIKLEQVAIKDWVPVQTTDDDRDVYNW